MSALLMGRVFYCALPAVAKLTLLALVDHAHDDGTEIYAGQRRIARKVGCSERTVRRVVEKLETDGWLIATPRLGSRGTNRYRIALEKLPDVPTVDRTSSGRPAKMADRPNDAVRGAVDRPNTPRRPDTAMSAEPTTKKKKQPTETRRMRLPEFFPLTAELRSYCEAKGCRDPARTHEAFVMYYRGSGKTQLAWPATFRTWVLGAHGGPAWKACGCTPVAGGRPPSTMDAARSLAARWIQEGKIA